MNTALIFLSGMVIGGGIELAFSMLYEKLVGKPLKIHHRFTLANKISLFSLPIWGVIMLAINKNISYGVFFILAAIIGPCLEYLLGKGVHKYCGVKLWTYKYGALSPYTSIYAIPYWGGAAILFLLLARFLGL